MDGSGDSASLHGQESARQPTSNLRHQHCEAAVRSLHVLFEQLDNQTASGTHGRTSFRACRVVGHAGQAVLFVLGHAARLPLLSRRPVRLAMEVFGVNWTRRHEGIVLRQVGYWRNSVRFLQLAWEQVRHVREAFFWVECAECRTTWKDVWGRWLSAKGWLSAGMVGDPLQETVMGRQLLQLGQRFHLLPMRHVPSPPYRPPRRGGRLPGTVPDRH